jgi:hypothetical protein
LKICADEHESTWIVGIIRDSCLDKEHSLEHVEDYHLRGVQDEIWVRRFARAGGEAIVSADANMLRRHHEVIAICESSLRLIVLPSKWANSARNMQAAHIMFWWPKIQGIIAISAPRKCWKVPWGFSESDTIQPITVDFEDARRKIKKAERRIGAT